MNILSLLKVLNLLVRFSLELFALGSLVYWGLQFGKGSMKIVLAVGAPLLLGIVWGIFGSPRSQIQLPVPIHLVLEILVFGLPFIALYTTGKHDLAFIYIISAIINRILMYMWGQE
ncbi:YrdB family protein [Priestia koreensis]|uniref:YrdB family protein n=1 Tax=Priestia koreensis TaxID=284581 RepID=UPI003D055D87